MPRAAEKTGGETLGPGDGVQRPLRWGELGVLLCRKRDHSEAGSSGSTLT